LLRYRYRFGEKWPEKQFSAMVRGVAKAVLPLDWLLVAAILARQIRYWWWQKLVGFLPFDFKLTGPNFGS
jgi:hypothetical protein